MLRPDYTAIQQLFHSSHPSVPFFVAVLLGLLLIFLPAMFFRKNKFSVIGRLILITGGSQGLGEAMGVEFAKKGADVLLVSRSAEKLKIALEKVEAARVSPEQKFSFYSADLTKPEDAQKAFTSCERVPDIVICCAGAAIPGFFADQSTEVLDFMWKAAYCTTLWTAHAAINAMIRSPQPPNSPKRKIVFTSSLLSFTVLPGFASYSPAKAAIRMLADTLREECVLYDIDVHCSFPASILSPGFEEEAKTKPELTRKIEGTAGADTSETVARHIIGQLERGHKHITYQFVGDLVKNMMPGMTPMDNPIYDGFTGFIGFIAWPFVRMSWRKMILDYKSEHAKRELPKWPN